MELEAIFSQLLPEVKGMGSRGEWVNQEAVFEPITNSQYQRKVVVGFWGDRAQDVKQLQPGERVKLSLDAESREYNGRWYTNLRAWKVERIITSAVGGQAQGGYAAGAPAGGYAAGGGYGAPAGTPAAAPAPAQGGTEYDWGTPARPAAAPAEAPASKEEFDDLPF